VRFIGLGGTDEVGASCYLKASPDNYELGATRLLVDAGLRPSLQGEAGLPALAQLDEHPLDLMVLTHAHLDHIGALPLVKRRFPKLPVYATRATKRIALEVLADAVKVGESQGVSLYSLGEAVEAVARTLIITPAEPLAFPGGQLTPYPAGHLLGAVGLLIETEAGRLFHTGDFSNIAGLTTDPAYRTSPGGLVSFRGRGERWGSGSLNAPATPGCSVESFRLTLCPLYQRSSFGSKAALCRKPVSSVGTALADSGWYNP
jgi:Cft2 family RNA processing exonuclease